MAPVSGISSDFSPTGPVSISASFAFEEQGAAAGACGPSRGVGYIYVRNNQSEKRILLRPFALLFMGDLAAVL